MKKSKRIISMILAVIMLSMTAIGINAEELIIGVDDLLEAVGIIEHDHEEEELLAMAAGDECNAPCPHDDTETITIPTSNLCPNGVHYMAIFYERCQTCKYMLNVKYTCNCGWYEDIGSIFVP